jgi:phosphoglycolate phosphatase
VSDFDAIVYDLDGTLVRLVVDWDAVAADVAAVLRERDVEPPHDLWEMLERADETGHRPAVEEAISDHERAGARASERLPLADSVPEVGTVGVCSLNCEAACHIALERHALTERVGAVVGRDSVATAKPHPEPLLATLDALGVPPEDAVFIGDSERDEVTAQRAGVAFYYVSEWRA